MRSFDGESSLAQIGAQEKTGPVDSAHTPARQRMFRRVRRIAAAVLIVVLAVAVPASVATAEIVSPGVVSVRLLLAEGLVLLVMVVAALVVARRSTRILDSLFGQQDRLMLAVAHEIRSPLSRALVAIDDGLDGAIDPVWALRRTATHVETASELINDLLVVTRVMSGAVARPEERVALHKVVADAADKTDVGEATLELDLRPVIVVGSASLLRRAVSNLVRNASRHAYRGGPGTIWVRVDDDGITVADDGPGVSSERLEDLRYERPLTARRPGSGLGLNVCGWVAEMHGGRLVLSNRPWGGFEARIVLPVEQESPVDEGGTQ